MSQQIGSMVALALCMMLPACGGGAGGGDSNAAAGSNNASGGTPAINNALVEGAWNGNTARDNEPTGDTFDLLLMENSTFYAIFRNDIAGATPALALSQGRYAFDGSQFTANGASFVSKGIGSLSGTAVSAASGLTITGQSINSAGMATLTFAVQKVSATDTSYNYNTAASLSTLSGQWSNAYLQGESGSFQFAVDTNNGEMKVSNGTCTLTGTVKPRSSGKNVFDVSTNQVPPPCVAAGHTYSGVALSYIASSGKRLFTAALQTPDKSIGTVLYAHQ